MSPYDLLAQSMRDAFSSPDNAIALVIFLLILGVLYVLFRVGIYYYRLSEKTKAVVAAPVKLQGAQSPRIQDFNIAQKKVVYEVIAEFKRNEIIAGAIPAAVLERFAGYFYHDLDRMKISDNEARRMAYRIYPIESGAEVEIGVYQEDKLLVFESKVLSVSEHVVIVRNIESMTLVIRKGLNIIFNYNAKGLFISGESTVQNVLDNARIVLTYPNNLKVSDERHFTRVPLPKLQGKLVYTRNAETSETMVELRDISLEGIKIKSSQLLKKNLVYRLTFEDRSGEIPFEIKEAECVVSNIALSGENFYEYGMTFIYLGLVERHRLAEYTKARLTSISKGKPA